MKKYRHRFCLNLKVPSLITELTLNTYLSDLEALKALKESAELYKEDLFNEEFALEESYDYFKKVSRTFDECPFAWSSCLYLEKDTNAFNLYCWYFDVESNNPGLFRKYSAGKLKKEAVKVGLALIKEAKTPEDLYLSWDYCKINDEYMDLD